MSKAGELIEKIASKKLQVGDIMIFTKSGSEVEILDFIGKDMAKVKRVDSGKEMLVPQKALVKPQQFFPKIKAG